MKKLNIIIITVTILVFSSCEDFLLEKNLSNFSDKNFFRTREQIELAVLGAYEPTRSIVACNQFMAMVGTDEARMWKGAVANVPIDTWTFDSSTKLISDMWSSLYVGIDRANSIIWKLDKTNFPGQEKLSLQAEMKFLRGFYYYWLVRLYGEVPVHTKPTLTFEDAYTGVSSVKEVCKLIELDFKEAGGMITIDNDGNEKQVTALPVIRTDSEIGRATYGAAHAYLASLYLSQTGYPLYYTSKEQYQKIADECQVVIDLASRGVYMLQGSYASVFETENNAESIFEMQAGNEKGTGCCVKTHMGVIGVFPVVFHQDDPDKHYPDPRVGRANIRPCWKFYNSFQDKDIRKEFAFSNYTLAAVDKNGIKTKDPKRVAAVIRESIGSILTDLGISKYKFPKGIDVTKFLDTDNPLNWTFMRYAEVLLTMAEADYHLNGYASCKKYLEPLAYRAGVPVWDGTGNFEDRILQERGWELCFEGKRWFDLQRTDKLYEYVSNRDQGMHVPYGDFYKTSIHDNQHYFPIPKIEVDNNPYLK